MPRAVLCNSCINLDKCQEARTYCNAMNELFSVYNDSKKQVAQTFIDEHRSWLSIVDAEQCEEYEKIASEVIDSIDELHFIKELEIKNSQKVIALITSNKYGKVKSTQFGTWNDVDVVITDKGIPKEWVDFFKDRDIELFIV